TRTADPYHHLVTAPDADGVGCPRMRGTIVGDVLFPWPHAEVLIAPKLRDDLDATKHRRSVIDKGCHAIEGIRCDTVNPEIGVLRLECLQSTQGELWFGGILGLGRRFGWPLCGGDTWLLEGLFLLIPCTKLRGGLREDNAHGDGDCGRYQHE